MTQSILVSDLVVLPQHDGVPVAVGFDDARGVTKQVAAVPPVLPLQATPGREARDEQVGGLGPGPVRGAAGIAVPPPGLGATSM